MRIFDYKVDGGYCYTYVYSGGIGDNKLGLRMKSQWMTGMKVKVNVYGFDPTPETYKIKTAASLHRSAVNTSRPTPALV